MMLSKKAQELKPSATLAISATAGAMKKEGIDVLDLSAGQPAFPTPDYIKAACKEGLEKNMTKYTPVPGMVEFKELIRQKFKRDNGIDYAIDEVMCGTGGKQILFNAVQALMDPGDEAIIPAPYWVSYPPMVQLAGGVPVIVQTTMENGFMAKPEDIKKAITDKTKILFLNSPSNPTGMVYSKDVLIAIGKICVENDIVILSDEIYECIEYGSKEICSMANLDPSFKDITVTCNGVSKSFAMTGWRIGFGGGPKQIIGAMTRYQSHSTSNANSLSQYASMAALKTPKEEASKLFEVYDEKRDLTYNKLTSIDGIESLNPDGAFYIFPKVSAYYGKSYKDYKVEDSLSFCKYMLEEMLVAMVPGVAFGNDEHVRISYSGDRDDLIKALDRVEEGLKKLS